MPTITLPDGSKREFDHPVTVAEVAADIGPGLAGTAVMPTFHPSYVLRSYTPQVRGQVWSDLQQVMGALGLNLPEKD